MKVAFGSVVYKEAYHYCEEFVCSINKQDSKEFEVLLLNDNLNESEFKSMLHKIKKRVEGINRRAKVGIVQLRIDLIKEAKKRDYDLLILGDFDDLFSADRVSRIMSGYDKEYGFFYNDLYLLTNKNKFFDNLPNRILNIETILESNFLGLSNTAINLRKMNSEIMKQLNGIETNIFDWDLFSILLLNDCRGKKIEECRTYYRIHGNNIAGKSKYSTEELLKEIEIKIQHYSNLKQIEPRCLKLLQYYMEIKADFDSGKIDLLEEIDRKNEYWWGMLNSKNDRRKMYEN